MRVPAAAVNWRAPQLEPSTIETDALPYIGQLNPIHEKRFMRQHGRMLSGLGMDVPSVSTVDPTTSTLAVDLMPQDPKHDASGELIFCEEEDDAMGSSGIFDGADRPKNLNPNMGVFSQNGSVPGFISREVLFSPNKSLFDSPNGGDVIVIPGGGGMYVDKRSIEGEFSQPFGPPENRQAVPPSSFQPPSYWWPVEFPAVTQGPTLANPFLPPPPTWFDQVTQPGAYNPMPGPSGGPTMTLGPSPRPAHGGPTMTRPPATRPTGHPGAGYPRGPARPQGGTRPAPTHGTTAQANYNLARRPSQKLAGLGDASSGPSTTTVVLTGMLVGAGVAMLYSAFREK